jgi:hypothetical protein
MPDLIVVSIAVNAYKNEIHKAPQPFRHWFIGEQSAEFICYWIQNHLDSYPIVYFGFYKLFYN